MRADSNRQSFEMCTRYDSPRDITAICRALQNEGLPRTPTGEARMSERDALTPVDADIEYYCPECDASKCICEWADACEDMLAQHMRHMKRRWPFERQTLNVRHMVAMQRAKKAVAKTRSSKMASLRRQRAADLGQ